MRQERDAAKGAGGAGAVASRLSHALGLAQLAQEAIPWGEILSVAAPRDERSRSTSRELPAPASAQPQPAQPLQGEPSSQFKGEMSRDTGETSRAVPPPPAPSAAPAAGQAAGQVAGQAAGQAAGQVAGASQPTAVESARLESLAWLHSLARGGGGGGGEGGGRLEGVEQTEPEAEPEADCRAGATATAHCAGSGGGGSSGGGSEGGATIGEEGARPALSCSPVPPSRSPLGGTPLWESAPDRSPPGRGSSTSPGRGSTSPGRGSRADQAADQLLDYQPAARAPSEAGGGGGVEALAASGCSGCSGDAEGSTGPPPPPPLAARLHAAEAEVLRLRVWLSTVQEERDVWRLASQVTNS